MKTLFSIIVPVYNVEQYLRPCLDSVLAQSYDKWECICVDDGSIDGSAKILDEYSNKDIRFRVVHKLNGGVASARNAALDLMKGDWLVFVDSDDLVHPELLSMCNSAIQRMSDADIVGFRGIYFNDGCNCEWHEYDESVPLTYHDLTAEPYSSSLAGNSAWLRCFKVAVHGDLRELPLCVGEDILYLTQAFLRCKQFVEIDAKLYGYRQRAVSATHCTVHEGVARDELLSLQGIFNEFSITKRSLSGNSVRGFLNCLTESFFSDYRQLPKSGRRRVKPVWRAIMQEVLHYRFVSGLQKIRVRFLLAVDLYVIGFILCYLPFWLKCKGVHR